MKELSLRRMRDWKVLDLFEREARVLRALDHPSIPRYLDYFEEDTDNDRRFYIVQASLQIAFMGSIMHHGTRRAPSLLFNTLPQG